MEPLIRIGDRIIVDVGNRNLKRFDIVVVYFDGKLVCHYLWAMNQIVKPILFQTRSLKYGEKDFPVSFDDYLGRVVSHNLSWMDKCRIVLSKIFKSK
jgi:hypothetical protein